MHERSPRKILVALAAAALCGVHLRGVMQETSMGVEADPWVGIRVTPTETVLLPGEPPRLIVEVSTRPYPGSEIAVNRSERFWITPEGGQRREFLLSHHDVVDGAGWSAISVRSYVPQSLNLYLHPRPDRKVDPRPDRELWPWHPTFAFTTPGTYTLRVGLQTAFVRSRPGPRLPPGAEPPEDVHVTPMLLANPVEFTIVEPPPSEEEPCRFVLSNGWFCGSVRGGLGHWHGGSLRWPPVEDLQAFIDRFPGSRYADHARLRIALMQLGDPLRPHTPAQMNALAEIARLLEAIRCDGFSRADEALQWLALVQYRLGREAEARAAWDRLMALPYPSPCKVVWERVMAGRAGAPAGE